MKQKNEIIQWAKERGIIDKATPRDQFVKVAEEVGEIAAALARDKREDLVDAIGDTAITLIILAEICELDFDECVKSSYEIIMSRTGRMSNGIFIKEEDNDGADR